MSRSLIQTTNQTVQVVAENSIIDLGSVLRRFGCNCQLSGNSIELRGEGYYEVDASIALAPSAAGNVTVALFNNGVQVPGAIAYGTVGAGGDFLTLPITTTIRQGCCCDGADRLTLVILEGASNVGNVSVRVKKS